MFELTGHTRDLASGIEFARELIQNGSAYNRFLEFVQAQGGQLEYIEHPQRYPEPNKRLPIHAIQSGCIQFIDAKELGLLAVELGAGRKRVDDEIDFTAGIRLDVKTGSQVNAGDIIGEICYREESQSEKFINRLQSAIVISEKQTAPLPAILKLIRPGDPLLQSSAE